MKLELIGYWRDERQPDWPDPNWFVDPEWQSEEREDLAAYLSKGVLVRAYMGLSNCRLCGRTNGSVELTDGAFLWPEGLAHYVHAHSVRLPQRFIDHTKIRVEQLASSEVDSSWWKGQAGHRGR